MKRMVVFAASALAKNDLVTIAKFFSTRNVAMLAGLRAAIEAEPDDAIRYALASPHVVQQKVKLPKEAFPSFENNSLQVLDRMLDTNPYVAFGEFMHGCLTRISTEAPWNDSLNLPATI